MAAPVKPRSPHPKGKGAWYFTSTVACPICGRDNTIRERRYDKKPKRPQDRYEYIEAWDGCNAL